jgi:DNA-directed RNA polymerase specialized sigma24 family protein
MFVMDFDYKMISDVLGKPQSSVRGIVFRAINAMKNELNNDKRDDETKC